MSKIIVVIGPTASGKTSLGVYLAKKYNACIINADAEQVYKDVNIGTAKITKSEMEGVKHYLLDFVPLDKDFNVYEYQLMGRKLLDELISKGENIIIVGGYNKINGEVVGCVSKRIKSISSMYTKEIGGINNLVIPYLLDNLYRIKNIKRV